MIGVVAHDAGGAEILASYVARRKELCKLVLAGPAKRIFEQRLGRYRTVQLDEALLSCEWVLCGSGWQTDFEWQAMKKCRDIGKHCVVFLDHWVNYRSRFIRYGEEQLPDEIWVGDEHALGLAREIFDQTPVALVENPYFADIREQFNSASEAHQKNEECTVLYLCENIGTYQEGGWVAEAVASFTQTEFLRYFLDNIKVVGNSIRYVTVRPHPSEPADKYNWVLERYGSWIRFSGGKSLIEEIAASDIVVGHATMAMAVALMANKIVINCGGPGGAPCPLPFNDIVDFSSLVRSYQPK
ncbi:MAG: hypothetical protein U5J62_07330 [Desulfurivibrio sp.]|nr:hypothetical protein [Desulfurivibrio sp.]